MNRRRLSDDEKCALLRRKLGSDASVVDFARKYVDMFSYRDNVPAQKEKVLQVYMLYAGTTWKQEYDLPAALLTPFQQVWNEDVPQRCRSCAKVMVGALPFAHYYCDEKACMRVLREHLATREI